MWGGDCTFPGVTGCGHQVDAICPDGEAWETVWTAVHDFESDKAYSKRPGHSVMLNASFDEVRAQDYDVLVIPGGRAPECIRRGPRVLTIVRCHVEADKPVAAICHGAHVLAAGGASAARAARPARQRVRM